MIRSFVLNIFKLLLVVAASAIAWEAGYRLGLELSPYEDDYFNAGDTALVTGLFAAMAVSYLLFREPGNAK